MTFRTALLCLLTALGSLEPLLRAAEIVPYGANWRYTLGVSEASGPDATAWRKLGFDDSAWTTAPAPIGYANPPNSPAESSLVTFVPSSQQGNYSSIFIRGTFVAKNPSAGNVFTVNVNIDDGCIVWINGTEVARYNVPDGELAYNQWASSANEPTLSAFTLNNTAQGPVVTGTNVIAVQLFNANATSSDLFFDLSLESDLDEAPPTVVSTDPPAAAIVSELKQLDIVFNENVTGVDASDLLVNGVPTGSITSISPREYIFSFPAQPNGAVTVSWASRHGITDLAGNGFAGGSWTYTVQPADNRAAVIISEFLADNAHGLKDEEGNRSDWIELLNTSGSIAALEGWFLTDNPTNLTKWRFPAITLDSSKYLLVFASGKNRTNTTAPLHTNFKIEKSGGYLALVDAQTNIVSEFAPYPSQQEDVSYGRDPYNRNLTGYLPKPTPGAANVVSGPGFAPEVTISQPGGVYTNNSVSVKLTTTAGQVRYTTDGSVPTTNSPVYTGSITISSSAVVKARSFQTGLLPGPVAAATYTLVDSSVASFTSNLPLLIISTGGNGIGADTTPRTFASVVAIDTFRGRSSVLGKPEFLGQGGIEVRGQSSAGFPKQQYNFSFENPYRQQEGVGLFGLPEDDDWALYAPYTDKPFLQNFLAYELYEKMGHYSVRRRFVEVFLDTSGGKVNYNSDYVGVYILVEKIKIDKNRVDIDQLTPYNTTEPDITGGYMFKKDKDSPGDYTFTTTGSSSAGFSAQTLKLHQPKPAEATTAQKTWLRSYLNQMERALYASNWKTATGTNHWSYYIDADSFVDYHWIVEFAKQIDGYRLSNYFYKPRGGKVHMSPIWDWNLSFGNADYLDGANTSNWYWQELGENDHIWLRRLMCGSSDPYGSTGDPDFNQRVIDRWGELRTNVLSSTNVIARAQEIATALSEAANRDFQRWPRLGTYVWPNPPLYSTPTTYAGIIQSFTNWVKGRYAWIDSQFLPAPTFDLPAGLTRPGSALTIGGSGAGTIYYTSDGSDPRLPGGSVSPKAVRYSSPVILQANSKVFARRLNGTTWSAPTVRSFAVQKPALAISEIMYHPAAPPAGNPFAENDFEYVELRNTGATTLKLAGVTLSGGIQFTFPTLDLDPGSYIVVVKNLAAFQSRYGTTPRIAGEFAGSLNNSGDMVKLTGALGEDIAEVHFKDEWYPITDGPGFSLVSRFDLNLDLNDASHWEPSAREGGSPGTAEPSAARAFPQVVVNELQLRGSPQQLELQNLSSSPADISRWFITDDLQKPRKIQIHDGTVIPPGGLLVFAFAPPSLSLDYDASGGEVYLLSADPDGQLTGYMHGFKFGAQAEGTSFGRYIESTGREKFVTQITQSIGQQNAGPAKPTLAISEIMYHPPDLYLNGAIWNNTEDEFVEIVNQTGQTQTLSDPNFPTNTWRIDGGVKFSFPPGTTLAPGAVVLVVNFDPVNAPSQSAAFRAKYSVPQATPLFGPYQGNLGNDGDRVSLQTPIAPLINGSTDVPYVVADEVTYADRFPWNAAADGSGFSLTRRDLSAYADDPANWVAAAPTPGQISTLGAIPEIVQHPKSVFAAAGENLSLKVEAAGAGPLKYQWLFKGQPIAGATSAQLLLSNVQTTNNGDYTVAVANAAGAVTSEPAILIVRIDSDNDGLPDDWEYAYNLNPYDPADAAQDADGDGFSNRDEYLAGTNPQARQSYLDVAPGTEAGVQFFAAPNRSYTILYSDSLGGTDWRKLGDVPALPQGNQTFFADPNPAPRRFYRIVTPSQ